MKNKVTVKFMITPSLTTIFHNYFLSDVIIILNSLQTTLSNALNA